MGSGYGGMLQSPKQRTLAWLILSLLFIGGYGLGLALAPTFAGASLFWPPLAIATAGVYLLGLRWLPLLFGLHLFSQGLWGGMPSLPLTALLAANSLLAPSLGAYLLQRQHFRADLARVKDVVSLLLAISLTTLINATGLSLILSLSIGADSFFNLWLRSIQGDLYSLLFVLPPILTWSVPQPPGRVGSRRELVSWQLMFFSLLVLGVVLHHFTPLKDIAHNWSHLLFVILGFAMLLWNALRFSPRCVASASLLNLASAAYHLLHNHPQQLSQHYVSAEQSGSLLLVLSSLSLLMLFTSSYTQERRRDQSHQEWLALHDSLTHCFNRRGLEKQLKELPTGQHLLIAIRNLQLNNIYRVCGFVAGDKLQQELVRYTKPLLGGRHILGQVSASLLVIIVPDCQAPEQRLNELRQRLQGFRFNWQDSSFPMQFALGGTQFDANVSLRQLIHEASSAAQVAQDMGLNRSYLANPDDRRFQQQFLDLNWLSDVHSALENERLTLFGQTIKASPKQPDLTLWAQPIQAHGDEQGLYFEVLVRMRREDGSLIPPGEFIPTLERYGLAPKLDHWVFEHTLTKLQQPGMLERVSCCSINLSGLSLCDQELISHIQQRLQQVPEIARKLCFEITETALIRNYEEALDTIRVLTACGCRFALDDFGTGLSSMSHLKSLPVHILKIDGAFIQHLANSQVDQQLVKLVQGVAKALGKITVAEFVEDEATSRKLAELEVDYQQGYFHARPCPLDELLPLPANQQA